MRVILAMLLDFVRVVQLDKRNALACFKNLQLFVAGCLDGRIRPAFHAGAVIDEESGLMQGLHILRRRLKVVRLRAVRNERRDSDLVLSDRLHQLLHSVEADNNTGFAWGCCFFFAAAACKQTGAEQCECNEYIDEIFMLRHFASPCK